MSRELKGFYRIGGAAFVVSGLLFVSRAALEFAAGEPPSNGAEILAWIASHSLAISLISETLFFATVLLVPAVIALYHSLAAVDPVKAAIGCGIIAVVIPLLAVLLIVHGRLVYPVYGLRAGTPDQAALVVAVFYGGMHAVDLLMAVATIILSLAMRGGAYGKPLAYLGFATALFDIIGSYPFAIGPLPTLVCRLFFAAWFIAVGWRLYRMREEPATA